MTQHANAPTWLTTAGAAGYPQAPAWLAALQQQQWQHFLSIGVPTRKSERWKYADLNFLNTKQYAEATRTIADGLQDKVNHHRLRHEDALLMLFVNGYFMTAFSDWKKLPTGVIACGMEEALEKHPALVQAAWENSQIKGNFPFASLNAADAKDGLFLFIPDNVELSTPIHLLSIVDDENEFIANPKHFVLLGKNSKATLIEEYFAFGHQAYLMNAVMNVSLESDAVLTHVKLQHEGRQATHIAHTFVNQKQNSHVNYTNFSTGGAFSRDELQVYLNEPNTAFHAAGFYHLSDDNQYIDNHIDINHSAPVSNSEMLYKGTMDKKSRAVFNGRLLVAKDAQKITAYQANHNLLLSNSAEIYSKPELEIYADDVKCKHGASTGQLDQEAMFYMQSRGIPYQEARAMLLAGFAEEILERVKSPALLARIMEMLG